MSHRTRILLAALVLAAAGGAFTVCAHREVATDAPPKPAAGTAPVLRFERDGLRYTLHLPTGDEGLFDIAKDPKMLHNLREEREGDLRRLREGLIAEYGAARIAEMRESFRRTIENLRGLGYMDGDTPAPPPR